VQTIFSTAENAVRSISSIISLLLTKEFHVIAIDLPGFGASEGGRHDMSPKAQGDHLAAIFSAPGRINLNSLRL